MGFQSDIIYSRAYLFKINIGVTIAGIDITIPCRGIGIQHIRKIIDNLNLLIVPKRRNRPSLVNRAGFIPNICIFTSRIGPEAAIFNSFPVPACDLIL